MKIVVVGEIAVKDFGGEPQAVARGQVFVFVAKVAIIFVFAEILSCGGEGVIELCAVGKEITEAARSFISKGSVYGSLIKRYVVGDKSIYPILLHCFAEGFSDSEKSAEFTLAALYLVPVVRHFLFEIGGCHKVFIEENVGVHKRVGFIGFAIFVDNRKAKVIYKRVVKSVCGFSIYH